MLRKKTKNEINLIMNELIEKIIPIFGNKLKKVVLYGSYARGDFDEESDIDVMFLVDKEEAELRKDVDKVISLEMDIFLKIMSMDKQGLLNRKTKSISAKNAFNILTTREREQYFTQKDGELTPSWKAGITAAEKATALEKAWSRLSYDQKLTRPAHSLAVLNLAKFAFEFAINSLYSATPKPRASSW